MNKETETETEAEREKRIELANRLKWAGYIGGGLSVSLGITTTWLMHFRGELSDEHSLVGAIIMTSMFVIIGGAIIWLGRAE